MFAPISTCALSAEILIQVWALLTLKVSAPNPQLVYTKLGMYILAELWDHRQTWADGEIKS